MTSLKILMLSLMILYSQNKSSNSLRILGVFPLTARSHFLMYRTVMRELAARNHQVDVISMFPREKPIPNYTDIDISTAGLKFLFNNMTYSQAQSLRSISLDYVMQVCGTDPCNQLSHPNIRKVLETKKGTYDVIVMEVFLAHCYIPLGQHLNAPIVGMTSLRMSDWLLKPFGNSLNPSYQPSIYSGFNQRMTFWERLQNTLLANIITYKANDHLDAELKYVEEYFGRKLGSIHELYKEVSLLLVNEHFSMDNIRPTTPDVIGVGGLHVADGADQRLTKDLKDWLDGSTHGCVYFTFGSMVRLETFPRETLKIFYDTFARIAPVRVLLKIHHANNLPPGLPSNVKTSEWLPQVAVLKHENVRVFITHGGLMGTQESVVYKVPMVGLPLFVDQSSNMRTYVDRKIALVLEPEELTTDALTDAVKTVLNDPTYRNNIEKISKLFLDRPMSAIDTTIYWIEYTARHGTVLKSPATELTWWQFHLLDVYGFILTCLLVALYIIKNIAVWLRKQTIQFRMKYPNSLLKHKKTK